MAQVKLASRRCRDHCWDAGMDEDIRLYGSGARRVFWYGRVDCQSDVWIKHDQYVSSIPPLPTVLSYWQELRNALPWCRVQAARLPAKRFIVENKFESVFTSNASTPSFDNILAACNPALLILLVIEIELTLFEQSAWWNFQILARIFKPPRGFSLSILICSPLMISRRAVSDGVSSEALWICYMLVFVNWILSCLAC